MLKIHMPSRYIFILVRGKGCVNKVIQKANRCKKAHNTVQEKFLHVADKTKYSQTFRMYLKIVTDLPLTCI